MALWRGEALADLGDEPSSAWRDRSPGRARGSLPWSIGSAAQLATGRHSTVVSELEALTARYPLRERLWANLMLALYRSGRQAEALSTYERARQVLASELGSDPSTELQRLHEQILNQRPRAAGADRTRPGPDRRVLSESDLAPGTQIGGYRIEGSRPRRHGRRLPRRAHAGPQGRPQGAAPSWPRTQPSASASCGVAAAASIDHPNVIPIFEAGEADGRLFIAMRYVEGTDLRTLLREQGTLETAQAARIVGRSPPPWTPPTSRDSCTVTSSPPIFSSLVSGVRRPAPTFTSRTSASPNGLRATPGSRGPVSSWERSTTPRPSRSAARKWTRGPTSTRSAACSSSA